MWLLKISSAVAFSLSLPLISTVCVKLRLFIPARQLYKNTSASVVNYVLVLSALVFNDLPNAISTSLVLVLSIQLKPKLFMLKFVSISILLVFNIGILSILLNDSYTESYNVEPSTFWTLTISLAFELILNLPLTSTVCISTRLFIPACTTDTQKHLHQFLSMY